MWKLERKNSSSLPRRLTKHHALVAHHELSFMLWANPVAATLSLSPMFLFESGA
jgi:hypothetical protein